VLFPHSHTRLPPTIWLRYSFSSFNMEHPFSLFFFFFSCPPRLTPNLSPILWILSASFCSLLLCRKLAPIPSLKRPSPPGPLSPIFFFPFNKLSQNHPWICSVFTSYRAFFQLSCIFLFSAPWRGAGGFPLVWAPISFTYGMIDLLPPPPPPL